MSWSNPVSVSLKKINIETCRMIQCDCQMVREHAANDLKNSNQQVVCYLHTATCNGVMSQIFYYVPRGGTPSDDDVIASSGRHLDSNG